MGCPVVGQVILISLFFLAIMAPGFVLNKIVQVLGSSYLYGLFVDDSLWDGNYFAQPF